MRAELTVRKTIAEHCLIENGDRVVLGLSGGPDSLCLLHILAGLRKSLGFELYAFHMNHMIRGRRADEDAVWLAEHCAGLGVEFRCVRRNIPALAKEKGLCEEEAGRIERHREILLYASSVGAKAAFAHNRDDQAETVLMRIMRGTGVHGLGAMEYRRKDGVIRPLLDTPRRDIEEYCSRAGLSPLIDSTNANLDYTRNRVRLSLIPLLERDYNPNLKDCLARLASNAREDDDYLRSEAFRIYGELSPGLSERTVILSAVALRDLHPAIFQRVLRMAFAEIGLDEDIGETHVNSLRSVIASGVGGKTVEFPGNYLAIVRKGLVCLQKPEDKCLEKTGVCLD